VEQEVTVEGWELERTDGCGCGRARFAILQAAVLARGRGKFVEIDPVRFRPAADETRGA